MSAVPAPKSSGDVAPRVVSAAELAKHAEKADLWVAIDGVVYDLTAFQHIHPGGAIPLWQSAGQDVTDLFYSLHRAEILQSPKYARLKIGVLEGWEDRVTAKRTEPTAVPYGEAMGTWRQHSPYYNESHRRFREAVRAFFDAEIRPTAAEDDEKGTPPSQELNLKMGQAGLIGAIFGSDTRVTERYAPPLPGGVAPAEFDEFHELIFSEEIKRLGTYGLADGLVGGTSIGLPPVLKFGSPELISRVAPEVLQGRKRAALAISEPYVGSDVRHIRTFAERSADGSHYIVTGVKKWITGGMFADYFTTLCVDKGGKGMVLLLVERDESVSTKPIKTSYSAAAGTSYVEFEETRVPAENLIGKPGMGLIYALSNFNKERWGMVAGGNQLSRLMVAECFKWAVQRDVFGKKLIEQPVIRHKLAAMAAEVESVHSLLEDLTYQMTQLPEDEVDKILAGPIALLKYKQTRCATLIADNACQIFGGRALTRTGMGQYVEKYQRSYKMQAILGGSEEILADFAIRQALKSIDPTTARL